jgi:putative transcriptional regulator
VRTVAETPVFVRYADEIWSSDERQQFISWIAVNPEAGDVIPGSGGCRKVRWSSSGLSSWPSCVRRLNMPTDIDRFQNDLLESVRQMRTDKVGRTTEVKLSAAAEARASTGLSQAEFAQLLGVSARTLQDWEQGRREPTGAARTLLRVAAKHPKVLLSLQE